MLFFHRAEEVNGDIPMFPAVIIPKDYGGNTLKEWEMIHGNMRNI
jgi:hypothetical protein